MMFPDLGILEDADLREAFLDEAKDFTPWLAQNLGRLAGVLGIDLIFEGREVGVKSFSADILARNPLDDSLVLIENQLEVADHSHLGQIMTYLAGLDARTIIWIARDFRDAHLSAVRWLNDHTDDEFAFFAVRLKVVRIGQSPMAPVFEVLVRPNEWERNLQLIAKETQALTPDGQFQRSFWTHYVDRYPDEKKYGKPGSLSRWRTLSNGLVISSSLGKGKVSVFIRGRHKVSPEEIYRRILPHAAAIGEATGTQLGRPDVYRFFERTLVVDTTDKDRWDELSTWLYETANEYERVLRMIEE